MTVSNAILANATPLELKYIQHTLNFEREFNTTLPANSFFKAIALRCVRDIERRMAVA